MNILITNDDSIHASGLLTLVKNLSESHNLTVVAPQEEMSGAGHSFTIYNPLFINKTTLFDNFVGYAVSGTPSDCVKIGIRKIVKEKPDLIISGINSGENSGVSNFYSGTIAGAREGVFFGIKSIALSLSNPSDKYYKYLNSWLKNFLNLLENGDIDFSPNSTYLNINFPSCSPEDIKGTKFTKQGTTPFNDDYEERVSPFNKKYYWLFGNKDKTDESDSDENFLQQGYVTITPLTIDNTDYNTINKYSNYSFKPN